MILANKRITKALIRLLGCTGWSAPVLFANLRKQVSSRNKIIISIRSDSDKIYEPRHVISNNVADSDEPIQLKCHKIFKRLAEALIRLRVCTGWSEILLVAHNTFLEIACHGSNVSSDRILRIYRYTVECSYY